MYNFVSKSEEETIKFAYDFTSKLSKSDIIVLHGVLGAGKTKFVQGILKYFDLENQISSPTFTIVNEYHSSITNIYHFDLYRLQNINDFYMIGGDEYFKKGICIFEWGNIIEEILSKYIKINISKQDEDDNIRNITIEYVGGDF